MCKTYCSKKLEIKGIVVLSEKISNEYRIEKLKQVQITDPERHTNRIMAEMQKLLRLPEEPRHIEGFDNSNIQGTKPRFCSRCFQKWKTVKANYRIFHIKSVECNQNDFVSMEEVIYRRYRKMLMKGNLYLN